MVTPHQRFHLDAVVRDADDIANPGERVRVLREAQDLIDGTSAWPDARLEDGRIHDWIERPGKRPNLLRGGGSG